MQIIGINDVNETIETIEISKINTIDEMFYLNSGMDKTIEISKDDEKNNKIDESLKINDFINLKEFILKKKDKENFLKFEISNNIFKIIKSNDFKNLFCLTEMDYDDIHLNININNDYLKFKLKDFKYKILVKSINKEYSKIKYFIYYENFLNILKIVKIFIKKFDIEIENVYIDINNHYFIIDFKKNNYIQSSLKFLLLRENFLEFINEIN